MPNPRIQNPKDPWSRAEFALVITLAFGYFILGSLLSLSEPPRKASITEASLSFLIGFETCVALVLTGLLRARGWNRRQLGLVPAKGDLLMAVGLSVAAYAAYVAAWYGMTWLLPGAGTLPDGFVTRDLRWGTVLLASIVNGTYEEVFVCGYVIAALRKTRSEYFAINVSIAIRLVYHLYQGTAAVISIIPMGFIFAYWFARTGRLWPVILAHILFDVVGLAEYVAD